MREIIIKYSRDIVLAGAVTTGIVRGALVMMRVDVVVSSTLGRPDSWQMELSSLLSISTNSVKGGVKVYQFRIL